MLGFCSYLMHFKVHVLYILVDEMEMEVEMEAIITDSKIKKYKPFNVRNSFVG